MKKSFALIIIVFLFILFCSSCSSTKVTYVKEFPYLPVYPGIVFISSDSKPDSNGFKGAVYEVKNSTGSDILKQYEKLLNDNGWKTTGDHKPIYIVMDKASHRAIITVTQNKNNAVFTIVSK